MTQETETIIETTENTEQNTSPEITAESKVYTHEEFKKIASEKKAVIDKLKTVEDKLKKIQDDEDKKNGNYEKLLADTKLELEQARLDLEKATAEAIQYKTEKEETDEATKTELMEGLTKDQKEFCKDKSVKDVRVFIKLINKYSLTDTDSGGQVRQNGEIKLNDKDKQKAEEMGLSDTGYVELKRREAQREKELQEKFSKLKN